MVYLLRSGFFCCCGFIKYETGRTRCIRPDLHSKYISIYFKFENLKKNSFFGKLFQYFYMIGQVVFFMQQDNQHFYVYANSSWTSGHELSFSKPRFRNSHQVKSSIQPHFRPSFYPRHRLYLEMFLTVAIKRQPGFSRPLSILHREGSGYSG